MENSVQINAKLIEINHSKTGIWGKVEYEYKSKKFNEWNVLGCDCFYEGQYISILIDSTSPNEFIFVENNLLTYNGNPNEIDTLIATNFNYNKYTGCANFDLFDLNNKFKFKHFKLLDKKPIDNQMLFLCLSENVFINKLISIDSAGSKIYLK